MDKPIGNTEKDLRSMSYCEFHDFLDSPEAETAVRLISSQSNSPDDDIEEDFYIYEEIKTGRFFFLEGGDAGEFCELRPVATLGYKNQEELGMDPKEANKTLTEFFKADVSDYKQDGENTFVTWFKFVK